MTLNEGFATNADGTCVDCGTVHGPRERLDEILSDIADPSFYEQVLDALWAIAGDDEGEDAERLAKAIWAACEEARRYRRNAYARYEGKVV